VVERLFFERLLLRYFYYAMDSGKHLSRAQARKFFLISFSVNISIHYLLLRKVWLGSGAGTPHLTR